MNEQKPLNPSNPYQLFSYFMFITIFGSGILMGINWKRLGRPEWMWRTILLSIFFPAVMIGILILLVANTIELDLPQRLVLLEIALPMSVNFAYLGLSPGSKTKRSKNSRRRGPPFCPVTSTIFKRRLFTECFWQSA